MEIMCEKCGEWFNISYEEKDKESYPCPYCEYENLKKEKKIKKSP